MVDYWLNCKTGLERRGSINNFIELNSFDETNIVFSLIDQNTVIDLYEATNSLNKNDSHKSNNIFIYFEVNLCQTPINYNN